ncbi:MAG: fucose isomerase [Lentisphaerae bacterium]|nr:fucose isomerase [Lentisphaerota bacterium]
MQLMNTPAIRLGIVGVSRDCFPVSLTQKRLAAVMRELKKLKVDAVAASVTIENEQQAVAACDELLARGCNAAVAYLGNFGPEGPTTLFLQRFPGPRMACAAAEENRAVLATDRGDALCGLLNCSYNIGLRRLPVHVPQAPVGLPREIARMIADFAAVARVVVGIRNLKVFGFGPRPQDFLACHAPIQPLVDLGVAVMENSELDLLAAFEDAASDQTAIAAIAADMARELNGRCAWPDLLPRLAQYELALTKFYEQNLGASAYGVFANKCWPAFERAFGFVPCYINSRLAGRGIPVACEVDLYGALSEYMLQCATLQPATLLDINNSVPAELLRGARLQGIAARDLFMGFHCGNTCSSCMKSCAMKYQLIMNRGLEGGAAPDVTRGTLEGQIRPGPTTLFRLQGTADARLESYLAEGEFLDIAPHSFGSIGVVGIRDFARFYRHVLIERRFPHHGGFGFAHAGRTLFDAVRLLGVAALHTPLPAGTRYPGENPFGA